MKGKTLTERVDALRADIDAAITARIEREAAEAPGVPVPMLRRMLVARGGGCLCRVAKDMETTPETGR